MEYDLLDGRVKLIHANSFKGIPLPDESVNCCVTSPPYWGLRNYLGAEDQLGQEKTPEEYVSNLVQVFREVRRILRADGTLWLNVGDSYAHSLRQSGSGHVGEKQKTSKGGIYEGFKPRPSGLKEKDLVGIPWMLAFALRTDGWYLRQDIIWAKPNPMPESVKDRCTKSHEYIFLLSKSQKYYYDSEAIQEDAVSTELKKFTDGGKDKQRGHGRRHAGFNGRYAEKLAKEGVPKKRNRRDVWNVATQGYSEAHFATFPPKLIEPCVLAGCPIDGIVLDPFGGSGTTGRVAADHGRRAVLLDINYTDQPGSYLEMAKNRILAPAKPPKKKTEISENNWVQPSLFVV
jgi:DNA modification methylase